MHVVPAGVHDRDLDPIVVGSVDARGKWKPCLFLNWQGIQIAAEHQPGTFAILQDPHDAESTDTARHGEAQRIQLVRHSPGGLLLVIGQLGMTVKVLVQSAQAVEVPIDPLVDRGRLCRGRQLQGQQGCADHARNGSGHRHSGDSLVRQAHRMVPCQ